MTYSVVLAAGRGTRMRGVTRFPKPLLPLNGETVLFSILDELHRHGVSEHRLVVSNNTHGPVARFVKELDGRFGDIELVFQESGWNGPGGAVLSALQQKGEPVVIVCGDTVFRVETLSLDTVWGKVVTDPVNWCTVSLNGMGEVTEFTNKSERGGSYGLIGLYTAGKDRCQTDFPRGVHELDISDVLRQLGRTYTFALPRYWGDCGTPQNYLKTRREVFYARGFNNVHLEGDKVVKRGPKVQQEASWYTSPLNRWGAYLPKAEMKGDALVMDYVPFNNLSDLYLFNPSVDVVKPLKKVLNHLDLVTVSTPDHQAALEKMYYGKTFDRAWQYTQRSIYSYKDEVEVNGKTYENPAKHLGLIGKWLQQYDGADKIAFLHGDLCLTNILYSPSHDAVRLIDPRGDFFGTMMFDPNYDRAKIWQCVKYGYDYIVNGMYDYDEDKVKLHRDQEAKDIEEALQSHMTKDVDRIVALQFLSMASLHSDKPRNAHLMYRIGTELFWKVFS